MTCNDMVIGDCFLIIALRQNKAGVPMVNKWPSIWLASSCVANVLPWLIGASVQVLIIDQVSWPLWCAHYEVIIITN